MTTIGSQLMDAATLMITGMTVVFVFLTILVYLVKLMSKLVPQEVPPQAIIPSVNAQTNSTQAVSPKVVAAISAAVHQYRTATVK